MRRRGEFSAGECQWSLIDQLGGFGAWGVSSVTVGCVATHHFVHNQIQNLLMCDDGEEEELPFM